MPSSQSPNDRHSDADELPAAAEFSSGDVETQSRDEVRRAAPEKRPARKYTDVDHSRSLRSKLVLALALMLAAVTAVDEIVRQWVIVPEFENLERVAAFKDTNRVLAAINTEIDFLSESASRDAETLRSVATLTAQEVPYHSLTQDGSGPETDRSANRIQWGAIVTSSGQWKWLFQKTQTERPGEGETESANSGGLPDVVGLLDSMRSQSDKSIAGMTMADDQVARLFAAVAIESESDDGELRRDADATFYVIGRDIDDEMISGIEQRTSVSFSLAPISKRSSRDAQLKIDHPDDSLMLVRAPLSSPSGELLADLVVNVPREVTSRSARTNAFARYLSLCGTCASLLVLLLLLQRIVVGRIGAIREHTEHIAQSGIIGNASDTPVLKVDGRDEIGQLADAFERMKSRLGDAQQRLSDASHAAGMSLVADTVIHNVGNVLTNVNSLIETATKRVDGLRIEPLNKLAGRLRDEDVDSALQNATPDYLQRLSETLEADKDDLAELLQTLTSNIQHIHQVVRDQRQHAHKGGDFSEISISKVINEAIRCCQAKLDQDDVEVVFDRELDQRVRSDRSLLLQVLINVIGNARHAMKESSTESRTLAIDVGKHANRVRIKIRDNGCGMDAPTLERIFDAHFTTRQTGSGLGLHFCAIALKRVGGMIRAQSDGVGHGATFIIEIPIGFPEEAEVAGGVAESKFEGSDA